MAEELRLRVPNEIVLKIFSYLSSENLLRLSTQTEDENFKSLLTCNKYVDFCREECTASAQDLRKFLLAHKYAIIMCLNHCGSVFTLPKSCIVNWNTLSELHVKDCGFSIDSVANVVLRLKSLQSFSWSTMKVSCREFRLALKNASEVSESVRTVDLDVSIPCYKNALYVIHLLQWFPKLAELRITLYCEAKWDSHRCPPLKKADTCRFSDLHSCTLSFAGPEQIYLQSCLEQMHSISSQFLFRLRELRNASLPWETFEFWDEMSFEADMLPPSVKKGRCLFYPLKTMENSDENEVFDNLITTYAGEHLQSLAILNLKHESPRFAHFLRNVISLSPNLTEINLLGTHVPNLFFDEEKINMLAIIAVASGLERLVIPACYLQLPVDVGPTCSTNCFKRARLSITESMDEAEKLSEPKALDLLANSCPKLTELDIRRWSPEVCSFSCSDSPKLAMLRDADLLPILRFPELEDLTLKGLPGVVNSEFLKSVGEQCPRLRTLRLVHVGPRGQCLYLPNLYKSLPHMNSLHELSLEHSRLPLEKESFWQSISKLSSLKRLCIISNFSLSLPPHPITQLFHSIETLRTLHIHSMARNFKVCGAAVSSALKIPPLKSRVPFEVIIENIGERKSNKPFPNYSGNYYVCQRMCHKATTVGILPNKCGLVKK